MARSSRDLGGFPTSYADANKMLRGRSAVTLRNNTMLRREDSRTGWVLVVRLHDTDIVRFHPDGRIALFTNGFRTPTTKDRIDACLPYPWKLGQKDWAWYLYDMRTWTPTPFVEGMTVPTVQ